MQAAEIKQLLERGFSEAMIRVEGEGCSLQLTIVSETFESMSSVKRQQAVYAHLGTLIADGSIHAVSMQTYTPQEWKQKIN